MEREEEWIERKEVDERVRRCAGKRPSPVVQKEEGPGKGRAKGRCRKLELPGLIPGLDSKKRPPMNALRRPHYM